MNDHEQARIAECFNRLRPDWPVKQLRTLLADDRMNTRPRRDVTVALAWVACESASASPYRVLEAGPWWRAAAVEDSGGRRFEPLAPADRCRICGKSRETCGKNPHGGHEFAPDIREPHDYDVAPVIAELKGLARPDREQETEMEDVR
jgi:hypothetical protein